MSISNDRKEVKAEGQVQKVILHSRNHTRWGVSDSSIFILAVRSLGRPVFLISSASLPGRRYPRVQVGAGEPTGVKAVKLIGTAACMWAHARLDRGAQCGRRAVVIC